MRRIHNRGHQKIGSQKAKAQALKDITKFIGEENSFYNRNYAYNEAKVWELLENFNPVVITIPNKIWSL